MTARYLDLTSPLPSTMPEYYRTRNWVFTAFGDDFPDYEALVRGPDVVYVGWGEEICPTTGRLHHQGCLVLTVKSQSTKFVSELLGGCHVEPCRGTLKQAIEYCKKEGKFTALGDEPAPGSRSDLKDIVDQLRAGSITMPEIILDDPMLYHKYGRTLEKVCWTLKSQNTRQGMTKGIWYWGPTGCGKTHRALEGLAEGDYYVHTITDKGWWDNYHQQKVCILDDFRGGIEYATLLRLVDKWPCCVPVRNVGPIPFTSETVIVTSSLPPEMVFHNLAEKDSLDQLFRRFTVVECEGQLQGVSQPRLAPLFTP